LINSRAALVRDPLCIAPRPCQSNATELPRAPRMCSAFPCTRVPTSLTLRTHLHGIEPSTRRHPHPAPRCTKTPPTAHRFTHRRSENRCAPAEPPSHRHRPPIPWIQHTMPPRTATHGAQWIPLLVHPRPNPVDSIKLETPSGSLPSRPFAPSPLSLICRTSPPCSRGKSVAGELGRIG
jgi:hypothetical protein